MEDDQLRRVRIVAGHSAADVSIDGQDVSRQLFGYSVTHQAGQAAEVVLRLGHHVATEFDGFARVLVGAEPDPGPAAAAFLAAIDPALLEKQALARHDLLDGGPHELTRAMLAQLREWAQGRWDRDGGPS
jgi:hypothetical protein